MSLLAQSGYGRSDKIEQGLSDRTIRGVVLSPKDETRQRLEEFVQIMREGSFRTSPLLLFDPQFYVATLQAPREGRLPEYDYYANNCRLGRNAFSPQQIRQYVESCLDYQFGGLGGLDYLISPSVLFEDFRDSWSQIALSMASASVEYHARLRDAPPLLVSVVTSENALRNLDGLGEYLDALSSIEAQGFYVLIRRSTTSYDPGLDEQALQSLLYLCYVLGSVNEYEVLVGYTDWYGFLLEAVGATHTASGWHQSLRQFSMARFLPAAGGRRPRRRYSSAPLLSCPLISPELEDIFRARLLPTVLSGSDYDDLLRGGPLRGEPQWTDEISCLAHWFSLSQLSGAIAGSRRIRQRLQVVEETIAVADGLYERLANRGIALESPSSGSHLGTWRAALSGFRSLANI